MKQNDSDNTGENVSIVTILTDGDGDGMTDSDDYDDEHL